MLTRSPTLRRSAAVAAGIALASAPITGAHADGSGSIGSRSASTSTSVSTPPYARAAKQLSSSHAPAGLRHAVHHTLGLDNEQGKLTAADGAPDNRFAYSLSAAANYAVVGALPNDDTAGAYVFVRNASGVWHQKAKLTAPAGTELGFGRAVAIAGRRTIVVGGADAAYVFARTGQTWTQQEQLNGGDPGESFGWTVSVTAQGYAVVGAPQHAPNGAAYVFAKSGSTWPLQAVLKPPDSDPEENFGWAVDISGSQLIVGSWAKLSTTGAAWFFSRSGSVWSEDLEVTASDPETGELFGVSVAIAGHYAIVGAAYRGTGEGTEIAGAAYVYHRGASWSEQAMLTASDGVNGDEFGISVDITAAGYALVGARSRLGWYGGAYLFHRVGTMWTQQAILDLSDPGPKQYFGWSVALSNDSALVGRPNPTGGGSAPGAVYVYPQSG